jgi:hypothetical protein
MLSDRKVTREVKLALFHLNRGLLVMIALGYSGALVAYNYSKCGVEVPLAWRLVAESVGIENFPKAYAGTESFSNGPMRMIGKNHAHSS